MARPKSKGAYTPLAANYYLDDAVLEAKPDAELLFVRCLSFLATGDTDGFISDLQMRHAVGIGLRAVERRIEKLLEVGLLLRVPGGYEVRSYLKWNKSADQLDKFRKNDRERKARDAAEKEANSIRNPDGIQVDSIDHGSTRQFSTRHDTENPLSDADASDGTHIPDDWKPTQAHQDKAVSLHLDVIREAARFRDHANRTQRRLKSWNTGFTNWLRKQAEFAQQRSGRPVAASNSRGNQRDAELVAFMTGADNNYTQEIER